MTPRHPKPPASLWPGRAEQLRHADRLAAQLLLQAPWPGERDSITRADALAAFVAELPSTTALRARVATFEHRLPAPLAEQWGSLYEAITAHATEAAYVLGLAIGMRLEQGALHAPPSPADRRQGREGTPVHEAGTDRG